MENREEEQRRVIPATEERLEIDKREIETGRVKVHKVVHEREVVIDEPIVETRVEVERVPVDIIVEVPRGTRQEGDTTIIPVYEEVTVVEKRIRLKEEIHIKRRQITLNQPQTVVLREEEVHIERDGDQTTGGDDNRQS